MIRAEPAYYRHGGEVFFAQYRTGRFWHTVRDTDGKAIPFEAEDTACEVARRQWWTHTRNQKESTS